MGDGQYLDIILFAMIAAFLVLRLRSVLGRRTGHERPPPDRPPFQRRAEKPASAPADAAPVEGHDKVIDMTAREVRVDEPLPSDPLAAGLTQIKIADPTFDSAGFLKGARVAFETIVQAYSRGEANTLRPLLNDEVFQRFSAAIDERAKSGETLETTLIGIKSADITGARIDNRTAFVTVSFLSEQVNVTRGKDGATVDGDPNHVSEVHDIWTFARNTRARDPNWTLVETASPS